MRRRLTGLWILAGLAACEQPSTDSGGTGGLPVAPLRIRQYTAVCVDDATYSGELWASAATNGTALLNLWDTLAPSPTAHNEEHDLLTTGTGAFGEILAVTLTEVASLEDVGAGTTLFGCAIGEALALPTALTYAIRVYDPEGELAECGAFGHDPAVVAAGTYPTAGGLPSSPNELASCTPL